MNFKLLFLFSVIIFATITSNHYFVSKVLATSDGIIINELFYDPLGPDTGFEWIEIYNKSESPIDVSGWEIQIAGTTFQTVFTFPTNTKIEPRQFLSIGESQTNADLTINILGFQNSGTATDGVRIIDSAQTVVDTLLYGENNINNLIDDSKEISTKFAIDVDSGISLCRKNYDDTDDSRADFLPCKETTIGEENDIPTQPIANIITNKSFFAGEVATFDGSSSYSKNGEIIKWEWTIESTTYSTPIAKHNFNKIGKNKIILSVSDNLSLTSTTEVEIEIKNFDLLYYKGLTITEIFAKPSKFDANTDKIVNLNDEFVEIANLSNHAIDLTGLVLADLETKENPKFKFDQITIQPKEVIVLFRDTIGFSLNDQNETVYILGPNGQIIDELSYKSQKEDFSINRSNNTIFTNSPTPGYIAKQTSLADTGSQNTLALQIVSLLVFLCSCMRSILNKEI